MKKYIGTKMIQAEPAKCYWMPSGVKVIAGKSEIVAQEIVAEAVSCDEGYKVWYSDGYVSWSPKEVFEDAYRLTDAMNFGLAIEAAKMGERIARKGWNGKNMYIFIAHEADFVTDADISAFDGVEVEVGDMFVMKTAGDTFQPGWLASQADMLADDWYIVE